MITFSSPIQFANYFDSNQELVVPAGRELVIEKAELLFSDVVRRRHQAPFTYLNRAAHLKGRCVRLECDRAVCHELSKGSLKVWSEGAMKLSLVAALLQVKFWDHFALMKQEAVTSFTLAKGQEVWALSIEDQESPPLKILQAHAPEGMQVSVEGEYQSRFLELLDYSSGQKLTLGIVASEPVTISLKEI